MQIWCVDCNAYVEAFLTNGRTIYPQRSDLHDLPFWMCPACCNHVGCHHKTKERTRPLGCIPNAKLRHARREIHNILDPLWRDGMIGRRELYERLSAAIGRRFHTAELRSIAEARFVYKELLQIRESLRGDCNE